MKLTKTAAGKQVLQMTRTEWEEIGEDSGWITCTPDAEKSVWRVAKRKSKKVNPWAVCNESVGKKENPEKFERCVMDVKEKQPIKKD